MEFYAKSNPVQTIQAHTEDVLGQYELLKNLYPNILDEQEWSMLRDAIVYHDLGKLDENFQNIIKKALCIKNEEVADYINHNFISGALVDKELLDEKYGLDNADLIIRAILFHHDREVPKGIYQFFEDYIQDNVIHNARKYYFEDYNCPEIFDENNVLDFLKMNTEFVSNRYIKIKGLLNKCDYCGSAGTEIEQSVYYNGKSVSQMTLDFFDKKNIKPRELQKDILNFKDESVVVRASTGCGKTEAALLWLGDSKAFYTLPLKISINAIYQRIQNVDNIGYKPALLLHSDALSYYINEHDDSKDFEEDVNPLEKYEAAKKLSAPLTVCTVDQILKCAFKYNGSEMNLATLSYSKLIIDEIQTYSPQLLGTIIYSLKLITKLGGKFAIVTATFPKMLERLFEKYKINCRYTKTYYGDVYHRHRIALIDDGNNSEFDFDKIAEDSKTKKVLVIVNTVKRAQQVYSEISSRCDNCRLLHSMFLKKDRQKLEDEILAFAPNSGNENEECGVWVSTQIVEASLDIDFDVLYTEMCTIDSLLQRLGRVYRSRDYFGEEPNVYILNNRNGVRSEFIDPELYDWSLEAIKEQLVDKDSVLLNESEECDNKTEMIDYVYGENHIYSDYYRTVKEQIDNLNNLEWYKFDKKDADKLFRNIDSVVLCPHEIYEMLEDDGKVSEWKKALSSKSINFEQRQKIKDQIAKYTVQISHYYFLDIEWRELFYKGSGIYIYRGGYDFAENSGIGIIKQFNNTNKKYDVSELII